MRDTFTLNDGTVVEVADFEFGFALDGKAQVATNDDGSVIIEGYASDFGLDRQDEAFETGAFEAGLKEYMAKNPVVIYHHKYDTALGKALDAKLDSNGLWVRAHIDAPEPGTQTADYVRKIKNGIIKGFSVGGKFYRRMTEKGPRIFKCDLREISVTPLPVNPRTLFAVAGKAFAENDDTQSLDEIVAALDRIDLNLTLAEGKASQHPDGPKVAALLYHLQQVHTLATDTKQDAQSEDLKNASNNLAKHIADHTAKLHRIAAKIGPLPNAYGSTML